MLKIKDNVDLKELEKFGFIYNNENEQFYDLDHLGNCILIQDRIIIFRVNEANIYEDFDLTILFDLIQADLVEKVNT